MVYPTDATLQAFINSVLEYLSNTLPPPLYSFVVKLLSHSFAAITAFASLCATLLSNAPGDWNAQTLLPPIITLLAAYLALSSLYRTTTWLLRLSFWFVKWGTLLGIFFGGVGYLLGNGAGNAIGNQWGGPSLKGILASLLDSPRNTQNAATSKTKAKKPKAWDSFERQREWQNRHQQDQQDDPLQTLLSTLDTAGSVLGGGWWKLAKSLVGNTEAPSSWRDTPSRNSGKPKEKGEGKAGKSHSR